MVKRRTKYFIAFTFIVLCCAIVQFSPLYYTRSLNVTSFVESIKYIALSNGFNVVNAVKGYFTDNRIYLILKQRKVNEDQFEFHSNEELDLTKWFAIDKPYYCGKRSGEDVNVVTIVFSTVHKFSQRDAIRQTWGKDLAKHGVRVLFLIAKSNDENIEKQVLIEDKKYKDVLQSPFIEDYYNETLKAMAMLQSLNRYCRKVKFVLKTDEDVIINSRKLFKITKEFNSTDKVILGQIFNESNVIRDVNNKWYVPKFVYDKDRYPPYPNGPVYIFTGVSIQPLLSQCYNLSPFYIDDAYVMGIVAENVGVRRITLASVSSVQITDLNPSKFQNYVGIHSYSAIELRSVWEKLRPFK